MVDGDYFIDNHATLSWQEAIAPFANGDAAMYVMGNFSVDGYLNAGLTEDQIDFFQFPEITAGLPRAEEAPADAFFIPSRAKNKEDARKFLAFIAQPDVQTEWNSTLMHPALLNSTIVMRQLRWPRREWKASRSSCSTPRKWTQFLSDLMVFRKKFTSKLCAGSQGPVTSIQSGSDNSFG